MTEVDPSTDWDSVRALTPARVGLGRVGGSIPTAAHLAFRADHARARDAVNRSFDADRLVADLVAPGRAAVALASAAGSRGEFVRRPDLGRQLSDDARIQLHAVGTESCDLAIVLCDGLSPGAVQRNGAALVDAISSSERLRDWSLGVTSVVTNGRVAIGDEIGWLLRARLVVVLIGERPGLSVPESIGAYLTFEPAPGRTDAQRNCVSNIHDRGLMIDAAARTVVDILVRARNLGLTGVGLAGVDALTLPTSSD